MNFSLVRPCESQGSYIKINGEQYLLTNLEYTDFGAISTITIYGADTTSKIKKRLYYYNECGTRDSIVYQTWNSNNWVSIYFFEILIH